jgi:hypothetical protein
MRFGFLILALVIAAFVSATPTALVKAQQPRSQSQSQEGLSQEKKKALSRYGPEDLFGPAQDDSRSRGAGQGGRQQRRGTPTPTPSAPAVRQSTTTAAAQPTATQPPTTSTQQPAVATPSATIPAPTLAAGIQQSPLSEDSPGKIDSKWAAPVLIVMALIVSAALIFTLTKLFEKIKEGSSG